MEKLLPCPICGEQPILRTKPEFKSIKYFCADITCGGWQKNEDLAAVDWNRRVREHDELILKKMGIKLVKCPNCDGKAEYDYQSEQGGIYPVKCDMCVGTGQITERCVCPEFIEEQGRLLASASCKDCEYTTDSMQMKELVLKLSVEGGYIVSDKSGGYFSLCPKCRSKGLTLES